jgi:hypothetical protein
MFPLKTQIFAAFYAIISPLIPKNIFVVICEALTGVEEKLLTIEMQTAGHLKYVGECYSHP